MNNSLASKYYLRVQQDIIDYSLIINDLIIINEPIKLSSKELLDLYNKVLTNYFTKFSRANEDANRLVYKYFSIDDSNPLVDNCILASVIKYYQDNNDTKSIKENKKHIVTWSIILSLSLEIWMDTNPFKKRVVDIKSTVLNRLVDVDELSYITSNIDESKISILFEKAAFANIQYKKFFKSFNSNTSYNTFIDLTSENKFFITNYTYVIDELTKYRSKIVKRALDDSIKNELRNISYNLLAMLIIKEILCQNEIKYYVVKVNIQDLYKNKNIDDLEKIFNNKEIKERLLLLIPYQDYMENQNVIGRLRNIGFNIMIDIGDTSDIGNLTREINPKDMTLIDQTINKNNQNYLNYLKEKKINILIESRDKKIMKNNF